MQFIWLALLLPIQALRPFDGTYTIVNKANGYRVFASTKDGLYIVDDSNPIYHDQMWVLSPQENGTYAMVNSGNGMRVLAQNTPDDEHGFGAMAEGPVYQDQKWWFIPQLDGGYVIENFKSGRRITAEIGDDSRLRFVAVYSSGPVHDEETWWIINQERDETSRLLLEIAAERNKTAKLINESSCLRNNSEERDETSRLMVELAAERNKTATLINESNCLRTTSEERDETSRLMLELAAERNKTAKLINESNCLRKNSEERDETSQLMLELAAERNKTAKLINESNCSRKKSEERDETSRLMLELAAERNKTAKLINESDCLRTKSEELMVLEANFSQCPSRCWMVELPVDSSRKLLIAVLMIAFMALFIAFGRRHAALRREARRCQEQFAAMDQEIKAEFGDMVRVGDTTNCGLGCDFGYHIFDAEINRESVRLIKIQTPGVKHADVEVMLIFNGCEVLINRQASRGVTSATWKKRFQFRPSDGLFEFREEQMQLEDGFLQLVFRTCAFQNRLVLFPRHFSLSASDADACWEYSADGGAEADDAEAWWNDLDVDSPPVLTGETGKMCLVADVDTESTASTVGALV